MEEACAKAQLSTRIVDKPRRHGGERRGGGGEQKRESSQGRNI